MAKIFISYKRNTEPDTPVASAVYDALRSGHEVFIDTTIQVGQNWAEQIQQAIKESDYLISFLSASSVHSEMVVAEIETAHHHEKAHDKPKILPVRLNYNESLVYPLSAYLNPLQWAIWNNDKDTPRLIEELIQAISGGKLSTDTDSCVTEPLLSGEKDIPTASANILRDLGSPEGTMPHESPFYIERESDTEAIDSMGKPQGVTITIKGPRQMGKSSLLNRLLSVGNENNMRTAFIDFQLIESASMENVDVFYKQFCSLLSWEFEIEDLTEKYWEPPLGQVQKTTNYLQKHLLKKIQDAQIFLAMDEVERMFASPFRSDFFSMLRSWHNNRARGGDWMRFNMALVTSTEPYQLIENLNQSPFNVGVIVELNDFNKQQVVDLNARHGNILDQGQVDQLFGLLGGHPYLTRKALFLIGKGNSTFGELLENAYEDNGPFGDHLRNHLFRLSGKKELQDGLMEVIIDNNCSDDRVFFQLRGAGLVKRQGNNELPRNPLYAKYFKDRLGG